MSHVWISNRAFTKITGIKKVCMICRTTDPKQKKCEKKSEPAEKKS